VIQLADVHAFTRRQSIRARPSEGNLSGRWGRPERPRSPPGSSRGVRSGDPGGHQGITQFLRIRRVLLGEVLLLANQIAVNQSFAESLLLLEL